MSEWLTFVKAYAEKHNIPYKQALRDASPTYKTRNEIKPEVVIPIVEPTKKVSQKEEPTKFKRKNTNKKVVENIVLKL
jgi:hypothetical protein